MRIDMISVLYVDDEPGLLEIVKTFLERNGQISVDIVTSAKTALTRLKTKNYDAILSDYQMPDMDGIAFLKSIRNSGNGMPFIIFTGRGQENVVVEALNAGADFYLQKGEDHKDLFIDLESKICQAVRRSAAERDLIESEERFRNVVEDQTELISRIRMDETLIFVNDAFCRYFGILPENVLGHRFILKIPEKDRSKVKNHLRSLTRENPVTIIEHRVIMPDGTIRWQQRNVRAIFNAAGTLVGYQSVGRDITDRKNAENALNKSLEEKERILREIHGRVRDNMQVVIALLQFQESIITSPEIARIVLDIESRIQSIVLIHENLEKSGNLIDISLEAYVKDLINILIRAYRTKTHINAEYSVDNIQIDQNTLTYLGLLITEVVSNSLKYAFSERSAGTISVGIHRDEHNYLTLSIHDDGIGIPDVCLRENPTTMGLQLIYLLCHDQLDGKILIERKKGTRFTFKFHYTSQRGELMIGNS
jgi:PAS domain S-box-containing protein